jgi:hypothetical protein
MFTYEARPQEEVPTADATSAEPRFLWGVRAGLSFSKYYGDTIALVVGSRQRMGLAAGLNVAILLDESIKSRIYFAPELLFHVRGVEREDYVEGRQVTRSPNPRPHGFPPNGLRTDSSSSYLYRDNLAYVQIPLAFRMDFGLERVRPYVSMGPVIGINVMAEHWVRQTMYENNLVLVDGFPVSDIQSEENGWAYTRVETITETTTQMENINPLDIGGILAAGVRFGMGAKSAIVLEGRYDLSFTRIYTQESDKTRNNSLMVLLGVEF